MEFDELSNRAIGCAIEGIHEVQLLTYMKLAGVKIGLLMNFNVSQLKDGTNRFAL